MLADLIQIAYNALFAFIFIDSFHGKNEIVHPTDPFFLILAPIMLLFSNPTLYGFVIVRKLVNKQWYFALVQTVLFAYFVKKGAPFNERVFVTIIFLIPLGHILEVLLDAFKCERTDKPSATIPEKCENKEIPTVNIPKKEEKQKENIIDELNKIDKPANNHQITKYTTFYELQRRMFQTFSTLTGSKDKGIEILIRSTKIDKK